MASLDPLLCRRLATAAPVARLATVTADGHPHVVPCCFHLDDNRVYSVVDGKPKSTTALRRLDNIAANPGVSLVVDHYAEDWAELWWVRIDGQASVVADPSPERSAALDALAHKYPQYQDQPPTGALIRVAVTGLTGWAFDPDRIPPYWKG